jgi:hypothetical protein
MYVFTSGRIAPSAVNLRIVVTWVCSHAEAKPQRRLNRVGTPRHSQASVGCLVLVLVLVAGIGFPIWWVTFLKQKPPQRVVSFSNHGEFENTTTEIV